MPFAGIRTGLPSAAEHGTDLQKDKVDPFDLKLIHNTIWWQISENLFSIFFGIVHFSNALLPLKQKTDKEAFYILCKYYSSQNF